MSKNFGVKINEEKIPVVIELMNTRPQKSSDQNQF